MAKIIYTKEQLKAFEETAGHYSSEEELLVGLKAISIREGERFVIQYEGLTGTKDPVTGITFTNDFPYSLYRDLIDELQKKERRKKYAQKMEIKDLEETALSLGIDNF